MYNDFDTYVMVKRQVLKMTSPLSEIKQEKGGKIGEE